MKPDEAIKEVVEKIHEGLNNLKDRTNYNNLRYKDKLWIIEVAIEKYREHGDKDELAHAVDIFRETNSVAMEGEATFNTTIWNSPVQAMGKMNTIGDLFDELESLFD